MRINNGISKGAVGTPISMNMGVINAGNIGVITPYSHIPQVQELFQGYVWFSTSDIWDKLFGGVKWHDEMPISYPRELKSGAEISYEEWISKTNPPLPNTIRLYLIFKIRVVTRKGLMMWFFDPEASVRVRIFLKDRDVIQSMPYPNVGEALYYVRGVFSDGFITARSPISSLVYFPRRRKTFVLGARLKVDKEPQALVR
ncbi:MAG: hypothetical protein ACO2O5_00010 [Candidatus Caldipriscus sp.]